MQIYFKIKNKIRSFFNKNPSTHINRKGSYPFISGDTFLSISDEAIISNYSFPICLKSLNKKEIIFVENDLLSIDWVFNYCLNFKTVILHNGDIPPEEKFIKTLKKRKINIFATNIKKEKDYINPIPIGIENAHYEKNGDLDYYNIINIKNLKKIKSEICFTSFTVNNANRIRYQKVLKVRDISNENKMSTKKYRNKLENSYFVISPPGNGIDCHRTWEAFYHKTIPVIEKEFYLFEHLNLPVFLVDNIEDFFKIEDSKKKEIYYSIIEGYREEIYMDWWIRLIQNKTI